MCENHLEHLETLWIHFCRFKNRPIQHHVFGGFPNSYVLPCCCKAYRRAQKSCFISFLRAILPNRCAEKCCRDAFVVFNRHMCGSQPGTPGRNSQPASADHVRVNAHAAYVSTAAMVCRCSSSIKHLGGTRRSSPMPECRMDFQTAQ